MELPEGLEYIGTQCFCNCGLEEIRFPASLRVVGFEAFYGCDELYYADLNEGLEVLGEKWNDRGNEFRGKVFAESGIRGIRIPSTLRKIEVQTFYGCKDLEIVELSEGLEVIGAGAFAESGIESVVLPQSTRAICGGAFAFCEHLRSVSLNEGLEVLGKEEEYRDILHCGCVFIDSALNSIVVPSTVKVAG